MPFDATPPAAERQDVTRLLRRWSEQQDIAARDQLLALLYTQLRGMAVARLGTPQDGVLQPTVLVHEALMRMIDGEVGYRDRVHFLSLAALKMRSVLVDHARAMAASKRGGGVVNLTLSHVDREASTDHDALEVLALNRALEALARLDGRAARTVEWMYFGGMGREEIALALDVSVPTVDRDLRFAKAWLNRHLADRPRAHE
ncbi:ECF-type sigma factor [Stenotrophomonas bentonitica]|uniref:ECF-type sigma factor n=1 Tax=Stenotrophomonas bentonitica TaxID=1450134 RepID=UPI0031BBCD57